MITMRTEPGGANDNDKMPYQTDVKAMRGPYCTRHEQNLFANLCVTHKKDKTIAETRK